MEANRRRFPTALGICFCLSPAHNLIRTSKLPPQVLLCKRGPNQLMLWHIRYTNVSNLSPHLSSNSAVQCSLLENLDSTQLSLCIETTQYSTAYLESLGWYIAYSRQVRGTYH